jgi:cytochrome c-type biogenesis protein CcmH
MNFLRAPLMQIVPDRKTPIRAVTWLVLSAAMLTVFAACITGDDLTPEQRAYTLDRELMCPVCDGQTIDQSHAQIAEDMKLIVREKIAEGESNNEIKDYFVARYGEIVLASPQASGFNLLVWLMPVVIAGGGGLAVVWVLKNMRRNAQLAAAGEKEATLADKQLEQYLEKVDSDIGYGQLGAAKSETTEGRESGNG